jgi:hypothetical protein
VHAAHRSSTSSMRDGCYGMSTSLPCTPPLARSSWACRGSVSGSRAATSGCRWQRPSYFAYRVSDFDNVLGRLATDAAGRWWFTDGPDRSTNIR